MTSMRGPLPRVLTPLTWIAARIYGVGVALRNARFDGAEGIEILEVHGCRVPVISVGNITAGGTGKSPYTAWICNELLRIGKRPVIALRGYRASTDAQGKVTSDEAEEYAESAPGALVVVGAHRYDRLREALSKPECASWIGDAVVVLDDGFQHRQLARTLDIVLVDATKHGLDGDLLPHGWLREPACALRRASMVIVTKANNEAERIAACRAVARERGVAPEATCTHAWSALAVYEDGVQRSEDVSWLRMRRVGVASAIGNPAQFLAAVESAGAVVVRELRQSDHRAFSVRALEAFMQQAERVDACVLTRKDFVKLNGLVRGTLIVPKLTIAMDASDQERVLAALALVVHAGR
ncbi:MAG: tetraacyldisaccharide 4'-kinase [Phycisphaerales bacterium]|nr:tetraacyldisaccharide 4'-kinase [Phycisphaerales bacterium]